MEFSVAQLQYLEHLNIDVWVPRDLPVAEIQQISEQQPAQPQQAVSQNDQAFSTAPAHIQQAPQPETQSQPQANPMAAAQHVEIAPAQSVVQSSSQSAQAAPIPNQVGTSQNQVPVQAPVNQPLAAPAFPQADPIVKGSQAAEQAPAFNIQFWCYGSGLWMVTDQVELLPEHHKFVHNVAGFLQGKKRKPRHVGIFSWPMLDSPNIDQGPAVASKHLADHIKRLADAVPMKKIVAFGDCEKWFEGQPIVSTGLSISDVFTDPIHKKQLWYSLLPHQILD